MMLNYPFFVRKQLAKIWQPVMYHSIWTGDSNKPYETMNIPWWCIHGKWMDEICEKCSELTLKGSRERTNQRQFIV